MIIARVYRLAIGVLVLHIAIPVAGSAAPLLHVQNSHPTSCVEEDTHCWRRAATWWRLD